MDHKQLSPEQAGFLGSDKASGRTAHPDNVQDSARALCTWHMGQQSQGFTLVEVLVAMICLSVGMLGLYAVTLSTIRNLSFSDNIMIATTLAQDRMEQIKHTTYAQVIAANFAQENYGTMAGYEQFQRTVTIHDNTPEANMKTVMVRVAWRDAARATRDATLRVIVTQ
jgi:type IV pilus modification protein PilV